MLLLLTLVFVIVFGLFALILIAGGAGASRETRQTIAALDSALASSLSAAADPIVDIRKQELFSALPWLNRWLLRYQISPRVHRLLYQANVKWTPGMLLLLSLVGCALPAYLTYLRTGALLLSLAIGAGAGSLPALFVLYMRGKRFRKFEEGLPEALDLMVTALRAGQSILSGLALVAAECADPIGHEFRICFEEQNYGLELRSALGNLVERFPLQDLRIVTTAILIQKESGGNLAEVLDKASAMIRDRFRLKKQMAVHTAQGRLTGWILSLLPPALGVLLYLMNPESMQVLWTRAIGVKLLCTAVGMTVVGTWLIQRIVRMDV
jgi:tight adherence protein B